MTVVSNDPVWWPVISYLYESNYFAVASFAIVAYDWTLTLGQECELIWRQRWSLMTALYVLARYLGIPYALLYVLEAAPSFSMTDAGCNITGVITSGASVVINAMLNVIVIVRLHAMYQRSRKMLVFLLVIFLATQIAACVMAGMQDMNVSAEEYIFSGVHLCGYNISGDAVFLTEAAWILGLAWETLTLCLAVWIVVKHFRELQRASSGWTVADCFTLLIESHVFYFASFVAVSCLQLIYFSPKLSYSTSVAIDGVLRVADVVQMFVLGPRLILGVREYHANLVANSDEGTAMTSIAFQERVHISTGGGV